MEYDPIKNIFAAVIRKFPILRITFYKGLDLMFLRSWYVRRELKELRKLFGNKKIDIYDAGTGFGQYAYFISKNLQPNSLFAVDVKKDWIEDCKKFFKQINIDKVEFAVEDLTKIEHENRFDLIVCVDVMEHIENDVKVFENYYRALREGGYVLINTPSIFGGSDAHHEDDKSFVDEHARIGYSFEDFKEKMTPLGFKVHKSKYSYGFWGDKAWRLGIKFPMQMLNFSKLLLILLPIYYIIFLIPVLIMMYIDFQTENNPGAGIIFIAKK